MSKSTGLLFRHILMSAMTPQHIWEEPDIPVSSRFIDKHFRGAKWRDLRSAGLVSVSRYYIGRRRSREFRINEGVLDRFIKLAPLTAPAEVYLSKPRVDFITGKRSQKKQKSPLRDHNKNEWPQLVRRAMEIITEGYFDDTGIAAYMEDLEREVQQAEIDWLASTPGDKHLAYQKYVSIRGRYHNDSLCRQAILNQTTKNLGNGLFAYRMAYNKPQMAGRIGQKKGGLQSCSREMKKAAYERLKERGLHNYDLRSSQVCILRQFFEEAGMDATWLKNYAENEKAKSHYADVLGISTDCWKKILYALLMGAFMPPNINRSSGGIAEALRKEVAPEKVVETYRLLKDLLEPLSKGLDAWHNYLIGDYLAKHGKTHKGEVYIVNEVGMLHWPNRDERVYERKSRVAAFLLQGKESAFIHELTGLSKTCDYTVIANEHDGLVTLGEIPQEAVEEAAKTINMKYCNLDQKEFC